MAITLKIKSISKDELIAMAKSDLALAELMAQRAYIAQDLKSYGEWMDDIGLAKGQIIILEVAAI